MALALLFWGPYSTADLIREDDLRGENVKSQAGLEGDWKVEGTRPPARALQSTSGRARKALGGGQASYSRIPALTLHGCDHGHVTQSLSASAFSSVKWE